MVVGALQLHVLSSRSLSKVLWGEAGNYDHFITVKLLEGKAANSCGGDNGHLSQSRALLEELSFASLREKFSVIYTNRRAIIGFGRICQSSHCSKPTIQSTFPRPTYNSLTLQKKKRRFI